MIFCGIDLAVSRPTHIALMYNKKILVYEVNTDFEIIEKCEGLITAIDSPLSFGRKSYRKVDLKMIKLGYKVLPPTWMKNLVIRAINLSKYLKLLETHPTSSAKNLKLSWKEFSNKKDVFDAVLCVLVPFAIELGYYVEISDDDGVIYLISQDFPYKVIRLSENSFLVIEK
jgi:predicted nuclease with RNAse H fold